METLSSEIVGDRSPAETQPIPYQVSNLRIVDPRVDCDVCNRVCSRISCLYVDDACLSLFIFVVCVFRLVTRTSVYLVTVCK